MQEGQYGAEFGGDNCGTETKTIKRAMSALGLVSPCSGRIYNEARAVCSRCNLSSVPDSESLPVSMICWLSVCRSLQWQNLTPVC